MADDYKIPTGSLCMSGDRYEAFATDQCPFLVKEIGGSGSVGCAGGSGADSKSCSGVIICPMRVYRCSRYPEYELAVRKTSQKTEVFKCPECEFEKQMQELGDIVNG